jgi:uncharacterized protein YdeI (YjbR/CyaY-like superfamily)
VKKNVPPANSLMKTLYVADRSEWRAWLERNSETSDGVWLLFYKKGSGKQRIPYDDAVEEALCFGWIDSQVKKIDEARYAQKFTPRNPASQWSRLNIKRAKKLIKQEKMMQAGLKAFKNHRARITPSLPTRLPRDLIEKFQGDPSAWDNFNRFPPSYMRMAIGWVASAKKQETQLKRFCQLIEYSTANKRIQFMEPVRGRSRPKNRTTEETR